MSLLSKRLGEAGEAFAVDFLKSQGYELLEKNYRAKCGEVDIVAREAGLIVFIEVKTRQEDGWDAFEAVHPKKQQTLYRVAQHFLLQRYNTVDINGRFDVLAVYAAPDGAFRADLLKNAFFR
ncbi:MAG: YraN family protein [Candidatus Omnitrophica bacterium]|nr:YraN family protein [Candidatus Omnitrophota bacterium]